MGGHLCGAPSPVATRRGVSCSRRDRHHRDRHRSHRRAGAMRSRASCRSCRRARRRPTAAELDEMVARPRSDVLVARLDGAIVGTLTLVTFRIPTGVRAWIEDVVVDELGAWSRRGRSAEPVRPATSPARRAPRPSTSPPARHARRPTVSTNASVSSPATPTSTATRSTREPTSLPISGHVSSPCARQNVTRVLAIVRRTKIVAHSEEWTPLRPERPSGRVSGRRRRRRGT